MQNTATRILTETKTRAPISPVLEERHWLPIRIDFKALQLVGVAQRVTPLPRVPPRHVGDWGWNPGLGYTNKSPWARLLTLHWPTCNMINLVSHSGEECQLNAVASCDH